MARSPGEYIAEFKVLPGRIQSAFIILHSHREKALETLGREGATLRLIAECFELVPSERLTELSPDHEIAMLEQWWEPLILAELVALGGLLRKPPFSCV